MNTTGAHYECWKQATSKELQFFLKTAWKEPTRQLHACDFAAKKKSVMQLLVFSLKPMTAEKKALGLLGDEYENRIMKDFRSRILWPLVQRLALVSNHVLQHLIIL